MNSDLKYKLALTLILFTLALLVAKNVFAEEIKLNVYPRIYVEWDKTTFRVRWQITKHKDNRAYTVAYTCESGAERLTFGEMDGEKSPYTFPEWFPTINTGGACTFYACVYRVDKTKQCVSVNVGVVNDDSRE